MIMNLFRSMLAMMFWAAWCTGSAQVWCPPGATWSYTYSNGWTHEGYARFTYTGDVVLNDTLAQRITIHEEGMDWPNNTTFSWEDSVFTAVHGDLVSIWTGARFDTLYYFGALPGDHWQRTVLNDMESMQLEVVQDTGSTVIDGIPLRYLAMEDGDTLMERLGSLTGFMLPWTALMMDAPGGSLRCYADGDIDFKASWWAYGCASWAGLEELNSAVTFSLSPNPGNGTAHLAWPAFREFDLEVRDALGRIVHRERIVVGSSNVELPYVKAGVYDLLVTAPDGTRASAKWIKQ